MADAGIRVPWSQRLYLRIYLAVLVSLAVLGAMFTVAWHRHSDPRPYAPTLHALAGVVAQVLPPANAPPAVQQAALAQWRQRMQADLALYDARGREIASVGRPLPLWQTARSTLGWLDNGPPVFALRLPDQRWLLVKGIGGGHGLPLLPRGVVAVMVLIALGVAVGAYPIVRRLTGRLERLQRSVDALGAGQLSSRVAVEGHDEVAGLATSFNRSAARIEALLQAQKTLLSNASHELRSPLARIRMAIELMQERAPPALRDELTRNIAELDQLIDEILLASRLDATADCAAVVEPLDLTALVAEECAAIGASLRAQPASTRGDARLLRRLLRNLLENARRHGEGGPIEVSLTVTAESTVQLEVRDHGPGVPEGEREHIFAPFYRLPGSSEQAGGAGLGLSLVRQIASVHGGSVACIAPGTTGSCFRVTLPV